MEAVLWPVLWTQLGGGGARKTEDVEFSFTRSSQFVLTLCVFVWLRHLCRVDIIEHDDGRAVVVKHEAPEVLDRVGQRMLGNDEGRRLLVALQHNSKWRSLHF